MGLDISIGLENSDEVYSEDYKRKNKLSLSRTFCNLMLRQNDYTKEPEFEQIFRLTGLDITPFNDMNNYPEEEGLEFHLDAVDSEEEKQEILAKAESDKEKVKDNIDKVMVTLNQLIDKLSKIENLPSLLTPADFDTIGIDDYFSDFEKDERQSYVGNNFGRDLRNFRRLLETAKSKGTTTVWFIYG